MATIESNLIVIKAPREIMVLKGKFSSGIEGALASTSNRDFNWKQLSEIILCIFFFYVLKVYLSNIDSETAEMYQKGDFEVWACMGTARFIMIWNITVRCKFWRTYLFQDAWHASIVSLLCKNTWKQWCIDRCVVVSLKFELNESIIKQLSIYLKILTVILL